MNTLLPIIEELSDAADDAERARWLLSAPASVLMTYQTTIVNRLRNKHFLLGVRYLEAEIARYRARRSFGEIAKDNPLRDEMMAIVGFRPFDAETDTR